MRFTPPWCGQDVFFLTDALQRGGMSYTEVAGFLDRDVGEVRDKAKRLGIKRGHFALRGAEAKPQYGFKRAPRAHDGGVRTRERSPA